jgi:hypothetical protein
MGETNTEYPDCPGTQELDHVCETLLAAAHNQPENRPLEKI